MGRFDFKTRTGLVYNIIQSSIAIDSDAQSFFNRVILAGGSLSSLEQNAINQLVIDLKSKGLWASMKAVYPMVGASAAACSQNLKSSSFTGTFSSGWTFASTGATPNGINAYMDPDLNISTNLSLNSTHYSYYSRTNIIAGQVEMGASTSTTASYLIFNFSNQAFSAINSLQVFRNTPATPTTGLLIGSRISSSQEKYYTNNVNQTNVNSSTTLLNLKIFIGCYNNGGPALFSSKQCAFASIGDGLTDTQASDFYTAVQAFQTTLSRQL
jgi:hypothetical protein